MINITQKTDCCGCTACANACPVDAIAMKPDQEGFLYPQVDRQRCVNCGLCEKICPMTAGVLPELEVKGYILRHRDPKILEESTSGGAFSALAEAVFAQGGLVYGAGYDENMAVVCKKATSMDEIGEMRGSKFVQSRLDDVFRQIRRELERNVPILFTGTPCQIQGLLAYLGEKPANLICVDFICRGVPSPGLWENYVRTMERKFGSKMVGARFKHKTYGYHATTMKVDFENGKTYYGSGRVDPMMKAFVTEMASRPSCGQCAFKTVSRPSDLTMFDCYAFSKITGSPDDNRGYSSLLVHSALGGDLLEQAREKLTVYPADVDALIRYNGIMARNSAQSSPLRPAFFRLAAQQPIDAAMQQVSPITLGDRLTEGCKKYIHKLGLIGLAKKIKEKWRCR